MLIIKWRMSVEVKVILTTERSHRSRSQLWPSLARATAECLISSTLHENSPNYRMVLAAPVGRLAGLCSTHWKLLKLNIFINRPRGRFSLQVAMSVCVSPLKHLLSYYSHSELAMLIKKQSKITPQKKVDFWVFENHPAMHIGGVSRGLWLLLLGLVTCDR